MASGSLASTMKTSGTNLFDDWDIMDTSKAEPEKPKEYLEFNDDPLALVCAMLRASKDYSDIGARLEGVGTRLVRRVPIDSVIEAEDRERAIAIRKHFRNKILMRRLKNMHLSKFMLAVDDIIESPRRIEKDSVRPLMKLPDFYEEDKATETIFNSHNTLPAGNTQGLDTTIEYVGTVNRRSSTTKVDIQYWRTPNNYLVRLVFPLHDMGKSAWDFLAQQGKVKIKTKYGCVSRVTGYDYFVYTIGAEYEIQAID